MLRDRLWPRLGLGRNVVLSCGGLEQPATARIDGGDDADMRKFIFLCENVTTRGKEEEEKTMEFMCQIEVASF